MKLEVSEKEQEFELAMAELIDQCSILHEEGTICLKGMQKVQALKLSENLISPLHLQAVQEQLISS